MKKTAKPNAAGLTGCHLPALLLLAIAVLLGSFKPAAATASLHCVESRPCPSPPVSIWAPYPFYNDNVEYAVGVACTAMGVIQPQFGFIANVFVSSNDTFAGFPLARDYQLGTGSRFFADFSLLGGEFGRVQTFQNGNPNFPDETASSNESSEENYLVAEGTDLFVRLPIRYLLPIGAGRDEIIHTYRIQGGLLVPDTSTGGVRWNPLAGGRTVLELMPFYRSQDLELDIGGESTLTASGVTLRIDYDNTDWWNSPSSGSRTHFAVTRDWSGDEHGDTKWS